MSIKLINIKPRIQRVRGHQPLQQWEVKEYPQRVANQMQRTSSVLTFEEFEERMRGDNRYKFHKKAVRTWATKLGLPVPPESDGIEQDVTAMLSLSILVEVKKKNGMPREDDEGRLAELREAYEAKQAEVAKKALEASQGSEPVAPVNPANPPGGEGDDWMEGLATALEEDDYKTVRRLVGAHYEGATPQPKEDLYLIAEELIRPSDEV